MAAVLPALAALSSQNMAEGTESPMVDPSRYLSPRASISMGVVALGGIES